MKNVETFYKCQECGNQFIEKIEQNKKVFEIKEYYCNKCDKQVLMYKTIFTEEDYKKEK